MTIARLESPPVGPTALATGSSRDLRRLRDEFERNHCVQLPRLLSDALLDRILGQIDEGEFTVREHTGISTELCMETGKAPAFLMFLTNDPGLFEFVCAITACDRIGYFNGRVYRMMPGPEHEDSWHDDAQGDRMVAMSINLSPTPYSGGILEIRDHPSKNVLHRAPNTGPGDAVLFRIAAGLQHRVTAVEGQVPRTAYAGWFTAGPDLVLLHPNDAAASTADRGASRE
jgi:hypothetical protein